MSELALAAVLAVTILIASTARLVVERASPPISAWSRFQPTTQYAIAMATASGARPVGHRDGEDIPVCAVPVETGLNRSLIGKRIMSATFVTDILTVIGLSFITPNLWIIPFVCGRNLGVLGLLVVAKMLPKFGGVYPLARR
jgi:hypothetical protein